MGNNTTSTVVLLLDAVVALFGFFVVAPMIMNTIAQFGVHKRFAQTMVEEGIVSADDVKLIQPKKQLAGVIISAVVIVVFVGICLRTAPFGFLCGGIPLVVGFFKYRQVIQFNSLTIQRFQKTYQDKYDANKLNAYVNKMF